MIRPKLTIFVLGILTTMVVAAAQTIDCQTQFDADIQKAEADYNSRDQAITDWLNREVGKRQTDIDSNQQTIDQLHEDIQDLLEEIEDLQFDRWVIETNRNINPIGYALGNLVFDHDEEYEQMGEQIQTANEAITGKQKESRDLEQANATLVREIGEYQETAVQADEINEDLRRAAIDAANTRLKECQGY